MQQLAGRTVAEALPFETECYEGHKITCTDGFVLYVYVDHEDTDCGVQYSESSPDMDSEEPDEDIDSGHYTTSVINAYASIQLTTMVRFCRDQNIEVSKNTGYEARMRHIMAIRNAGYEKLFLAHY